MNLLQEIFHRSRPPSEHEFGHGRIRKGNESHMSRKSRALRPVGFVESQRYMMLEARLGHPGDFEYVPDLLKVLRESSLPLLQA